MVIKTPGSCYRRWFPCGILFGDLWPLLRKCKKLDFGPTNKLETDDLVRYRMLPSTENVGNEFERLWAKAAAQGKTPSIFRILFRMIRRYMVSSACFTSCRLACQIGQPLLLRVFLEIHEANWDRDSCDVARFGELKKKLAKLQNFRVFSEMRRKILYTDPKN